MLTVERLVDPEFVEVVAVAVEMTVVEADVVENAVAVNVEVEVVGDAVVVE